MKYFKQLVAFIKEVAGDGRIPASDKKIILILLALIVSPIDIIPDWIPVIGLLDDFMMIAIVLDYFFNHLDQALLLSHYPWGMKSFVRVKRFAKLVSAVTPGWIKKKVWAYKPSVY